MIDEKQNDNGDGMSVVPPEELQKRLAIARAQDKAETFAEYEAAGAKADGEAELLDPDLDLEDLEEIANAD